uniref:F-box domain-containing protein n=1 Tax=Rhodosorus marinus TaxID=101924 RepID=A0A7S3A146_9RHOD|mmetsp:Transcript_40823/g.161713  ORF Transcript_40823/g.161713 Transcript_40823/m.161713 type:complete len:418 (+) Transcript_40823:394-1647(+)|eukprot:CAMPEP_0113953930 /NCGR_PEP_ID=MMETSP0011_2-20120614/135_1 /TAXON_ID=101924 /ORGANISM="Rhodosorus marinus" /LENGTH=417 /DNA_ID=CAMNT_0000962731 /DNA_START=318 /DNA_END=1571 /DNA_ORIENTATION=- /assembly_acc=CAM_ASM_000156
MSVSILDLPDDLLAKVCTFLDGDSISTWGSSCRRFSKVCLEESVWAELCKRVFGERLGYLDLWPSLSSYIDLYMFLSQYAALEGDWYGDMYPRGQLLTIRAEDGAFVGRRVAVTFCGSEDRSLSEQGAARADPIFRLVPSPSEGESCGVVRWDPRVHAGVDGKAFADSGTLNLIPDTCPPSPSRSEEAICWVEGEKRTQFELHRPEMDDIGDDLSQSEEEIRLRHRLYIQNGTLPEERFQTLTVYHRLLISPRKPPTASPWEHLLSLPWSITTDENHIDAPIASDDPDLSGYWWGMYGPHGPEIVLLSHDGAQIEGRKITGDPNVPSGEVTFRVSAVPERDEIFPSSTMEILQNMLDNINTQVVSVHRGVARIAETGYHSAEWTLGLMLRYASGDFGVLFFPEGFVIDFTRLHIREN